jgi:hypothetical protein
VPSLLAFSLFLVGLAFELRASCLQMLYHLEPHLTLESHLQFSALAFVSNAAVDIGVQPSVWGPVVSSEYVPRVPSDFEGTAPLSFSFQYCIWEVPSHFDY